MACAVDTEQASLLHIYLRNSLRWEAQLQGSFIEVTVDVFDT
jgi:hypothetical protein